MQLITYLIALAREKGVSAYLGEGRNKWSAAHVSDVARLYRLVLEKNEAGAKYHAVGEEGIPMRDIAETIGQGLKIPVKSLSPEEAQAHFGWMAIFATHDLQASSAKTRRKLGWNPAGPGRIADLEWSHLSLSDNYPAGREKIHTVAGCRPSLRRIAALSYASSSGFRLRKP
jgi:nucleoside-diphosphate-sugar epimerase